MAEKIPRESLESLVEMRLKSADERMKTAEMLLRAGRLVDCVNRIYYAAFNAAKAVLNSMGNDPKTHSGMISEFGFHVVNKGIVSREHGIALRRSFEARESGDYRVGIDFGESEVKELLIQVKLLVSECKKVATEQLKKYK